MKYTLTTILTTLMLGILPVASLRAGRVIEDGEYYGKLTLRNATGEDVSPGGTTYSSIKYNSSKTECSLTLYDVRVETGEEGETNLGNITIEGIKVIEEADGSLSLSIEDYSTMTTAVGEEERDLVLNLSGSLSTGDVLTINEYMTVVDSDDESEPLTLSYTGQRYALTGTDVPEAESKGEAVLYTLTGERVRAGEHYAHGIYIAVTDGRAEKVVR